MKKFVYSFNEGTKEMNALLGSKGANLAEMTRMGLPVPFGFTITTEAHNMYCEEGCVITDDILTQIFENLADLESVTGKKFGEASNPLLLSVRSGSAFSMPGIMDTILNIGINDETVKGLSEFCNSERAAYDSYRRLIEMYGVCVCGIEKEVFDNILNDKKKARKCFCETELCNEALSEIVDEYKEWNADLILKGDLYRIKNPFESNYFAEAVVSKDKTKAILVFYQRKFTYNGPKPHVKMAGLDENKTYFVPELEKSFKGSTLMIVGLVHYMRGDFLTQKYHFIEK